MDSIIWVGDFNTPFFAIDTLPKEVKIIKNIIADNTVTHHDLIDIYRTLHTKTAEFTLFSSAHGAFTKIDYVLGYKTI